ncbi:MAG: hypothetical protein OXP66_08620 [Candidatus Tectomicrobia bacterium]|nr:hypothetical protein [Candidatus Tectomicrobia bacterium]
MISGLGLFAVLGVLAGVASLALRTLCDSAIAVEQRGTVLFGGVSSVALRTATHLCLGFTCLFALAAGGELWLRLQAHEGQAGIPASSAWGALWVYVIVLVLDFRGTGLSGAGRRAFCGWLLAAVGVLLVGAGLGSWSSISVTADPACADGVTMIDATRIEVGAVGLGLALVPLAGVALQGTQFKTPPLPIAAASVVLAIWMQPMLPAMGWLPLSAGAGAVVALLLVLALAILGLLAVRGPALAAVGVPAYFALSVGGFILMSVF